MQGTTSDASAAFREYLRLQRRARMLGGLTALAALAVVVGVVGLCCRTVQENFSAPRVRRAATEQAEHLLPALSEHGFALLTEVQPTYTAEAKRALRKTLPDLGGRLEHELLELASSLSKRTDQALGEAFVAAGEDARRELRAAFPELHDGAFLEARFESLERRLHVEAERFLADMAVECGPAQEKFLATLSRFPRLRDLSDEELQRRFLHFWLLLVDHELTGGLPPRATSRPAASVSGTRGG